MHTRSTCNCSVGEACTITRISRIASLRVLLPSIRIIACRRFNEMLETMSMNWVRGSEYKRASKRFMSSHLPNFIVALSALSAIMTSTGQLFSGMNNGSSNGTRPYVLMIHLPFDNIKQSVYLFIVTQQFIYLWLTVATSAAINAVLVILVSTRSDSHAK